MSDMIQAFSMEQLQEKIEKGQLSAHTILCLSNLDKAYLIRLKEIALIKECGEGWEHYGVGLEESFTEALITYTEKTQNECEE